MSVHNDREDTHIIYDKRYQIYDDTESHKYDKQDKIIYI